MNKLLLALTLGTQLLACRPEGQVFRIVVPEHPRGGPALTETTWWAGPGTPDAKLESAAREWSVALACGMKPRRVSDPEQASIKFICGHVDDGISKIDPHGMERGYLSTTVDANDVTTVTLDEWCDASIARSQALHAWGHALGYPHQLDQNESVLGSEPINPFDGAYAKLGIRSEELDNIRLWALGHGAPGCGALDPQWNWERMPDYYSSHPDPAEVAFAGAHD